MKTKDVNPEDVKVYLEGELLEGFPAEGYQIEVEVAKIPLKVAKVNQLATMPKYAKEGDAGFDLYSVECKTLRPFETKVFKTGLKFEIPWGYEVQIRPTSGKSLKTHLRVANTPGTIDSGYRGEIGVIIQNTHPRKNININIGERLAQGVLKKVPMAKIIEVDESKLSHTERGEGGYGHTQE
jgi:dUTP pyrophosphatase